MLDIKCENGKFVVRGSFEIKGIGIYRDTKIKIGFSFDDICKLLDKDSNYIYINLKKELLKVNRNEEEYATVLTNFYNNLEKQILENHEKISSEFLKFVFDDMYQSGNKFWKCLDLLKPEYRDSKFDCANVYSIDFVKCFNLNYQEFIKALKRNLPMFDFDSFENGIIPEYLTLNKNSISYQCSDAFENIILCGAYCCIDENFNSDDWHNF